MKILTVWLSVELWMVFNFLLYTSLFFLNFLQSMYITWVMKNLKRVKGTHSLCPRRACLVRKTKYTDKIMIMECGSSYKNVVY